MKINKLVIGAIISSILLLGTGCSHKNISAVKVNDQNLNCDQITIEYAKAELVLDDIDGKTGFSGRNVAMGLFFWPGIIVNQMNASDAREAAQKRIENLNVLAKEKNCTIEETKIKALKKELLPKEKSKS